MNLPRRRFLHLADLKRLEACATLDEHSNASSVQLFGASGGERVIRVAGIHKIGTGGAQQSFDLLDGAEHGLAGLVGCERKGCELPLEQGDIGNQVFGPPSSYPKA